MTTWQTLVLLAQTLAACAAGAVAVGWLLSAPRTVDVERGRALLALPWRIRGFAIITAGALVCAFAMNPPATTALTWFAIALIALVLVGVVAAFGWQLRLDGDSLSRRVFATKTVRWSEIASVHWNSLTLELVVRSVSGVRLGVPLGVAGLGTFSTFVQQRVAPTVLAKATEQTHQALNRFCRPILPDA